MKSRGHVFFLVSTLLFHSCQARRIAPPAAAILPGLGNIFGSDDEERKGSPPLPPPKASQQQQQRAVAPPRRPPPPPPRKDKQKVDKTTSSNPQEGEESDDSAVLAEETAQDDASTRQKPPPPPPRQEDQQQQETWADPYSNIPYVQQPWGTPPQQASGGLWGTLPPEQQQQQYGDWQQHYYPPDQHYEEFLSREHELMSQIQNLTASLQTFEQREDLHIRQLDVLTERVMDAEALAAAERNELMEKRANCTELGRTIALLNDELDEWKSKCSSLQEQHDLDEEKVKEIQLTLKERDREVEELAASIETARLTTERENYFADRRKRKKRGFFAWLFGIGRDDSDDDEERLQELAKSTLLRALQRERNNVDELEAVLSTLQQNNSAISEMVESRDMLISELNDRVAVFEEDKVVLKAALRQLQKEMKEEEPKKQKVIHDLQRANEEIDALNEEIQSLLSTHQHEVGMLQQAILEKQTAINETESNLTVIGTYVDKLEERLATFAITRRDIDLREQKCKEIEERAIQAQHDRDAMKLKVDEFAAEHEDLKKLLDELVQERTVLRSEKDALIEERDKLASGEKSLREALTSLEQDVIELDNVAQQWKSKVVQLELELGDEATKARTAQEDYEDLLSELDALKEAGRTPPKIEKDESVEETPELPEDDRLDLDESSNEEPSGTIWLPQGKPKSASSEKRTGPSDRKEVPLRSLRKFFSEKTGMHGVFTPSSKQLTTPQPRIPHSTSGMPIKVPPPPPPDLPSQ